MKTILIIIFLLILSSQTHSQPTWSIQNSGTTNNLNRIILKTSNNVQMLYIAGNNGTILRSSNLGLLWETVNSNTNSNLYSLEISDNDTGYAVGSGGTVIRTVDGGNTWSAMTSNTTNSLKEIRILPGSGKAIAVGENGTFLKLENNVWTFSQIDTTDLNSVSYAYFNAARIRAVGNNGIILNTTNNGINWSRINSNTPVNLNYILKSNYGTIIGNNGIALQISGTSVEFINSGTFSNLYYLNDAFNFACGDNGTVLRNWQSLYTNFNQRLNSIITTNYNNCFVVGENGLIQYAYTLNESSNAKQLYFNNISAWFRNNGSFNRDPGTGNAGFEWPKNSGKTARYVSGIWMGCRSGNDTLTAVTVYSSYDYRPGYVDDYGLPQGNGDPLYRIYRIDRGNTTSPDYQNWPVYQGAYVNSNGTPFFLGTQTMFYCYTDAYPHGSGYTSLLSLKAQILQTNWCYTNIGLGDVEFIEFKIINRSSSSWVNAYIAFWTDDDLGNSTDDAIGCDTNLNLAFTYNVTGNDPIYGDAPPAVGTKLLRSPIIATGNINDTVKYYDPPGSQKLRVKVGYKFIGMNVFNTYNNGSPQPSEPLTNTETYRVLEGKWRSGDSWINPVNNQVTKKAYSGDPVSGTGWIMTSGGDRRYLQSFGPFNMNPNDTQSIIIAQVIAKGTSNLNSITQLRSLSSYAQMIYNENFQSVLTVNNISTEIPGNFILYQNYPNPFNPVTNLEFGISNLGFVTVKVYDMLGKEVKTLVNENLKGGKYKVEFNGSNLPSGIYFYKMEVGNFVSSKKMLLIK